MDLYIQIGVLFLLGVGLSALIYAYTLPQSSIEELVRDGNKEVISGTNKVIQHKSLNYKMRSDITGKELKEFLFSLNPRDKLTVFVKTKDSRTILSSFGQSRIASYEYIRDNTDVQLDYSPTLNPEAWEYEKLHYYHMSNIFNNESAYSNTSIISIADKFGTMNLDREDNFKNDVYLNTHVVPRSRVSVMHSDYLANKFSIYTGAFYTDSVIDFDYPSNYDFSRITDPSSKMFVGDSMVFYSTIIYKMGTEEVVGLYFEEVGSEWGTNVLEVLYQKHKGGVE